MNTQTNVLVRTPKWKTTVRIIDMWTLDCRVEDRGIPFYLVVRRNPMKEAPWRTDRAELLSSKSPDEFTVTRQQYLFEQLQERILKRYAIEGLPVRLIGKHPTPHDEQFGWWQLHLVPHYRIEIPG